MVTAKRRTEGNFVCSTFGRRKFDRCRPKIFAQLPVDFSGDFSGSEPDRNYDLASGDTRRPSGPGSTKATLPILDLLPRDFRLRSSTERFNFRKYIALTPGTLP